MDRLLIAVCLVSVSAQSHQSLHTLPTIYAPLSSPYYGSPYQQHQQQHQHQQYSYLPVSPQVPQPASPGLINYFQPQSQSQLPHPPNSLILVFYRAKEALEKKPRNEAPDSRFSYICKGENIIPHPDDCFKFIRCKYSARQHVYFFEERTCPRGLAFDSALESCNYKSRVAGCGKVQNASDGQTQSLLTYHGELPEPADKTEETHTPSLYMMDLGDAINEEPPKPEHGIDDDASTISSVPLAAKNADEESEQASKQVPVTKLAKKPTSTATKKTSSRKTASKRPSSVNKSAQGSKAVAQQKESRKQQTETFSIGDPNENARMVADTEEPGIKPGVYYESEEYTEEEPFASTV